MAISTPTQVTTGFPGSQGKGHPCPRRKLRASQASSLFCLCFCHFPRSTTRWKHPVEAWASHLGPRFSLGRGFGIQSCLG